MEELSIWVQKDFLLKNWDAIHGICDKAGAFYDGSSKTWWDDQGDEWEFYIDAKDEASFLEIIDAFYHPLHGTYGIDFHYVE